LLLWRWALDKREQPSPPNRLVVYIARCRAFAPTRRRPSPCHPSDGSAASIRAAPSCSPLLNNPNSPSVSPSPSSSHKTGGARTFRRHAAVVLAATVPPSSLRAFHQRRRRPRLLLRPTARGGGLGIAEIEPFPDSGSPATAVDSGADRLHRARCHCPALPR
jgi:hypothetical protein